MAWFLLKDQPKRSLRKGICLRIRNLPESLMKKILAQLPDTGVYSGPMKLGQIESVIIDGVLSDGKVRLEVWSSTHEDRMRHIQDANTPFKYSVLLFVVDENEEWVCEADQGRGLIKSKVQK